MAGSIIVGKGMAGQSIDDILGIDNTKLGFFEEWQRKLIELRAAHAESERQRLVNATIVDTITDLMMVLDKDMRILACNKALTDMFPERPVLGEFCYSLFGQTGGKCASCPALQSLVHEKTCRETAIFQINSTNWHFDMVASVLPHPDGQGKAVLILKRDVTLQKKLLGQIYQAEKMASIGVLAAGVAHELNNPLTAITGFAEGVKRRIPLLEEHLPANLSADISEYISTILNESSRCRDIVQTLMNFSRPLPMFRPVVLADIIEESLSLLRHTLKQYERVLFCLDLAEDLLPVWADDAKLRQVLLNLITNALDAVSSSLASGDTVEEGTITIRTKNEEDYVVLQVEDTGTGILPEHMHTLFDPFFTTKPKGLGLGLSLCYNVVHSHGGDISITRLAGRTTVTVRLPLRAAYTGQLGKQGV